VKSQHTQRHTHAPRATKELVAPRRQRHIAPGCRTLDLPHSQSTASCTGPGHFPPLASVKGQGGSPRAAPPSCSDSCVCLWWLLGKIEKTPVLAEQVQAGSPPDSEAPCHKSAPNSSSTPLLPDLITPPPLPYPSGLESLPTGGGGGEESQPWAP
jgi:hypothetical protein